MHTPAWTNWPAAVAADFEANRFNPCVGTRLLSATDRVRVWEIRLQPGERIGFHRHVLDYFWTAVTAGKAHLAPRRRNDRRGRIRAGTDQPPALRSRRVQGARPRECRRD